ncbi:DUF1361 domain-containing protein [Ligilactobacillus sp. WILCCON 0076]|uniref:DUF1361 domain-containing protein n=1 Tax=Ligilactobacillus ubinensis TaxID=2876789 RepID=A0A9X2FL20_9LACO|nr:DUF1361 domain-containing protein [Ligilactobacillus ubinensis]MCP0886323.1 DUF1361 domain-containing protein [Ligilactobacillus ubinensis]
MSKKFKWFVRVVFWLYMLYVYITIFKQNSFYSFLLLNTFLAYIPIELSFHMNEKQPALLFWLLFVLWILFYPNAPYILTDLFHLARMNPYNPKNGLMSFNLHLWLNFTNLVASALASIVIGTWSVQYIVDVLMVRFKKKGTFLQILLVILLLVVSSIGVYIGRFLRLHTAYLFINPDWVMQQLMNMWNIRMLVFICFMLILQLIVWGAFFISRMSLNTYEATNNLKVVSTPKASTNTYVSEAPIHADKKNDSPT